MTNYDNVIFGATQLVIALGIAILAIYVTFVFFRKFFLRKYSLDLDNVAFAILLACVLISVSSIVAEVIPSVDHALRYLKQSHTGSSYIWYCLLYSVMFTGIGFMISLIVNVLGLLLFVKLTKEVDEFKEISENNIAIGIITGAFIVSMSFFVQEPVHHILESLIPYPELPDVR